MVEQLVVEGMNNKGLGKGERDLEGRNQGLSYKVGISAGVSPERSVGGLDC